MELMLKSEMLNALEANTILGDRVKLLASRTRDAGDAGVELGGTEFAQAKRDTLAAVDRLEAQVGAIV